MPRTSPYQIVLSGQERAELETRARRYTSSYAQVVRAKIVLMAAEGLRNDEIAARLDTPRQVVSKVAQALLRAATGRAGRSAEGRTTVADQVDGTGRFSRGRDHLGVLVGRG
jgi:hypothetical protein